MKEFLLWMIFAMLVGISFKLASIKDLLVQLVG